MLRGWNNSNKTQSRIAVNISIVDIYTSMSEACFTKFLKLRACWLFLFTIWFHCGAKMLCLHHQSVTQWNRINNSDFMKRVTVWMHHRLPLPFNQILCSKSTKPRWGSKVCIWLYDITVWFDLGFEAIGNIHLFSSEEIRFIHSSLICHLCLSSDRVSILRNEWPRGAGKQS